MLNKNQTAEIFPTKLQQKVLSRLESLHYKNCQKGTLRAISHSQVPPSKAGEESQATHKSRKIEKN